MLLARLLSISEGLLIVRPKIEILSSDVNIMFQNLNKNTKKLVSHIKHL